mmetsp:Transcript_53968/g.85894  ORF Transcript_53968/g.85894 Transcript_53968/m.85894 type:complete len:212 (-) Transcript_53968:227-862(-)
MYSARRATNSKKAIVLSKRQTRNRRGPYTTSKCMQEVTISREHLHDSSIIRSRSNKSTRTVQSQCSKACFVGFFNNTRSRFILTNSHAHGSDRLARTSENPRFRCRCESTQSTLVSRSREMKKDFEVVCPVDVHSVLAYHRNHLPLYCNALHFVFRSQFCNELAFPFVPNLNLERTISCYGVHHSHWKYLRSKQHAHQTNLTRQRICLSLV